MAEILSFHENLTDGQACADIYWYYRPDEMRSTLQRMPARSRPSLPSLEKHEVVVTNRRDTIEVSTIAGLAVVKILSLDDQVDKEGTEGDPVARFRFDLLSNTINPISVAEDKTLSSPSPGERSDSSKNRVRHRCKGELRPMTASRKSYSPATSSCDRPARKKTLQYKDILEISSPSPKHSSIASSTRWKQPASPLLQSHTPSALTARSKSLQQDFDSLLPTSSRKRKLFSTTPEYWVGKQSKIRKLEEEGGNLEDPRLHSSNSVQDRSLSSSGKGSSVKCKSTTKAKPLSLSPLKKAPLKDSTDSFTHVVSPTKNCESPVANRKRFLVDSFSQNSPERAKVVLSKCFPELISSGKSKKQLLSSPNSTARLSGENVLDKVAEDLDMSENTDSEDSEDSEDPIDVYTPRGENEEEDEEEDEEEEWTPVKRTPKTPGYSRLLVGGTPRSSLKTTSGRRVGRNSSLPTLEVRT